MENSRNSKESQIKKYGIFIPIILLVSCFVSNKAFNDKNILVYYYKTQKYANTPDGKFIKAYEEKLVDTFSSKFENSDSILFIEQLCHWRNIDGLIWDNDSNKIYFNSRGGDFRINAQTFSNNIEELFYRRVIELMEKDSLDFYSKKTYDEIDHGDEQCWLYITKIYRQKNRYMKNKYVFTKTLAFRRDITGY